VSNEQHTCNMLVQFLTVKLQTYGKHIIVRWQYVQDDLELDFWHGQENLSSLQCADWLSGPQAFYSINAAVSYSRGTATGAVQLIACFHLVPRLPVQIYLYCHYMPLWHAQAQLHLYTMHIKQISASSRKLLLLNTNTQYGVTCIVTVRTEMDITFNN